MANQNNNTKKEEVVEEQKQEQIPEKQDAKPEEKPAEKKEEGKVLFSIAGLEICKAPKKQKEEKTSEKQPKAKWGVGKAVAVATVGVTAVTGAVKVAGMVCDLLNGRGTSGEQSYEVPAYERQAIEGDYQDIPANDTTSSVSESTTNE